MAATLERDVVIARGEDATSYLQTQLTQDVESLDVGASAWSFLLTPKAEIVALLRATRTEDEEVVLDVDRGLGDVVRGRIDGMLGRTKVSFTSDTWPAVAMFGPGASSAEIDVPIRAPLSWPRDEACEYVGPNAAPPEGVEAMSIDTFDSIRVCAGWPANGRDLERATPSMTGLIDLTVSFTKGCYTGQEFVARVHYRDVEPPRKLVQIGFHPSSTVAAGDDLMLGDQVVGSVTSVAPCQPLAIGWVKRGTEVPLDAHHASGPVCVGELPVVMKLETIRAQ